jgi:hypothetical protein
MHPDLPTQEEAFSQESFGKLRQDGEVSGSFALLRMTAQMAN